MSYSNRYGKRPAEYASKSSHSNIVNDDQVKDFIGNCAYPKSKDEIKLDPSILINVEYPKKNPIKHIITVDGGYSIVPVKKTFPSSQITFFQFGTLLLNTSDLVQLSDQPFISREAMEKLKELERAKLVLPTKNVSYKDSLDLIESVRLTIYDYFKNTNDGSSLLDTLYWFLYRTYEVGSSEFNLSNCPNCGESNILLKRSDFNSAFICKSCKICNRDIFLTDIFRFHEVVDNEIGAGGILGYLTNLVEHFNIIHQIKNILAIKAGLIDDFLFLKDGPLGFFGQTARMHEPMRDLCNYLVKNHNIYLAGLEKSGAFVEHADEIKDLLNPGQVLILNNKHIYSYIIPGNSDSTEPYARTSYYSGKMIFKSMESRMHVVTIPIEKPEVILNPSRGDYHNLDTILMNIEKLRCDMYDNSIMPVALANKLVSLSSHPSSYILEKFAKAGIK